MKNLPLLLILILAIVGAIGCSDSSDDKVSPNDQSSPEDTVRDYLDAAQDGNPQKLASYCTTYPIETRYPIETKYPIETVDLEYIADLMKLKELSYSNISIEIVNQGQCDAEVDVRLEYQLNIRGEEFSGVIGNTVFLIKVENSWLIHDLYYKEDRLAMLDDEKSSVQLAMNTLMLANGVFSVKPQSTWINDLSGDFFRGKHSTLREYLRNAKLLRAYYQWDTSGQVYQCKSNCCPDLF